MCKSAVSETKRKIFSGEFKAKVALEVIRGIKTVNEIAQDFGVHPTQVGLWKKELQAQASSLFDAKRGLKPVDPSFSPDRLYSEIGRLKMELDWLKKVRDQPVAIRKQWIGTNEPLALP
jgi:transposase-like protein